MKLITDKGRWAIKDNSMIFGNIVWLCNKDDLKLYHLIDDEGNELKIGDINDYIVEEEMG